MTLAERLAEAIKKRDALTQQHYDLGGEHADHGTRNCPCELAKRAVQASDECESLVKEKYRYRTDAEIRDEALEEAAKLAEDCSGEAWTVADEIAEAIRRLKSRP